VVLDYYLLGHPFACIRSYFSIRARRRMFELFMRRMAPCPSDLVLDLGVTPDMSLGESNYFEAWYPFPEMLVAASIEEVAPLVSKFPTIRFQKIDPGPLPYKDGEFDIAFCSAVLEHVGDRSSQKFFLTEIARVSRKFFITTPNPNFPVEFHTMLPFVHWLPQPLHQRILRICGYTFLAETRNLNLVGPRELEELASGLGKVRIEYIRTLGLSSNLILWHAAS
jgi:hypothetical protein